MDTAHWKKKILPLAGFSKHRRPLVSWRPVWSPASCGSGICTALSRSGRPTNGWLSRYRQFKPRFPTALWPRQKSRRRKRRICPLVRLPTGSRPGKPPPAPKHPGILLDSPASESIYNRPSLTPNPFHGPCRWHPLLHSIRRNRTAAHPTWQSCPCFGSRSDRRNCFSIIWFSIIMEDFSTLESRPITVL